MLRSKAQSAFAPSVFRRFNSDEASQQKSADGEHGSVRSAIESATESASTYASEAAESVSESFGNAKESVVDAATSAGAAAGAYPPREPRAVGERGQNRRQPYNDRNGGGDRAGGGYGRYGGDRSGGYGDRNDRGMDRGGDRRGGYGDRNDRGIARGGDRERAPAERILAPTTGIYVGNLLFDVTADDLKREFEQFGPIQSVKVATDVRGLSKGYVLPLPPSPEITDVWDSGH